MTPGEHCERHEREIELLRTRAHTLANEVQEKEAKIVGLQHDLGALEERLPVNLGEWMGRVQAQLEGLVRGQNDLVEALRRGYVTVAEFEPIKAALGQYVTNAQLQPIASRLEQRITKEEFGPIKGAFYKAAAFIGLALLGAVMALVLKGGR